MSKSNFKEFVALFGESEKWSIKDIQNRLHVSRQTVYRYRDQLLTTRHIALEGNYRNDDNTLLKHENIQLGYLKWPKEQPFTNATNIVLSDTQIEALKLAITQMSHVTPILKSILQSLKTNNGQRKRLMGEAILYNPLTDIYNKDFFEQISTAITERRVARIVYQNARGEIKQYNFNSYKVISSQEHLYLVGESHSSIQAGYRNPISLRLDQITKFTLQQDKFKKTNFDYKTYAHKNFGLFNCGSEVKTVKVLFSKEKAQFIKRTKRHNTQKTTEQKDGSLIWEITVPICEGLIHWITSYGPHAKVLEPKELRKGVSTWAKGSLKNNT